MVRTALLYLNYIDNYDYTNTYTECAVEDDFIIEQKKEKKEKRCDGSNAQNCKERPVPGLGRRSEQGLIHGKVKG